ncbi:MAG TPA: glycoside hydrolase family 2 TIM barrel-domain containing protein [Candidatus Angelobacter sp.]|nr:glycoside hydrolase family 2 TIM barrel-domain containing protein [Candidatus Angelobacter sp.]
MKRVLALCAVLIGFTALAADSPRERLLLDFNWRFHLGDAPDAGAKFNYPEVSDLAKTRLNQIGQGTNLTANLPDPVESNLGADVSFVKPSFNDSAWRRLDLPHDWAVELPFDPKADVHHGFKTVGKGFPEQSIGWYRRQFTLPASDKGRRLWVAFDGVYRNSLVWLNGHCLGRNPSGYSSFRYDISKLANYGGKNELVVRVDASRFEGWFYEGAGIYRHVWLEKTSRLYIEPDGLFVWTTFPRNVPGDAATVHVQMQLINYQTKPADVTVHCEIMNPENKSIARFGQQASMLDFSKKELNLQTIIEPPREKALRERPVNLPSASPSPQMGRQIPMANEHFNSAARADQGFILWSPETPNLYKLITTVESNGKIVDREETEFGIRTIAFDAQKGFLLNGKPCVIKGTCDHQDHAGVGTAIPDALQYFRVKKLKEMGSNAIRTSHNAPAPELLEACDRLGMLVMDENRRVENTPLVMAQLKRQVMRDRNHPSVFIWSLGNEEGQLQSTNQAAQQAAVKLITPMQDLVHQLDPTRLCTMAMNAGWGAGFSKVIDVQGFNYHTTNIGKFHAEFPTKLTIGTETGSTRTTRGIYADDKIDGYVAAYGENGTEKPWTWWPYYATHPFTSGGFVWTGFDYRGEPTPYKWPCISSHYGLMDTCGFPKDIYYYYQAWWTDKPVLHLATGWGSGDGKSDLVRCFSNCQSVELFLNGKSLGRQTMVTNEYLDWHVPYSEGVLSAKGYRGKKVVAKTKIEPAGSPDAIKLMPDRSTITADGRDLSIIDISVVDSHRRVVPNAANVIHFDLKGPGKIIGVGNGDPSSHESDKARARGVFNGYAQVIIQSERTPGKIELIATSPELTLAKVKIKTKAEKISEPVVP